MCWNCAGARKEKNMGNMTPLKAIRAKCLDCCCGQSFEVKMCTCTECPLYPYRLGKNPNRKGIGGKPNLSNNLLT